MLPLAKDDGERNEEHVQQPVEHRHIQGNKKDDELAEEELKGHDEEDAHPLSEGAHIKVLLRHPVLFARFLAHFLGAPGKDGRGIRLGDGESDEDPDDAGEDKGEPVEPSPA